MAANEKVGERERDGEEAFCNRRIIPAVRSLARSPLPDVIPIVACR